MTDAELERVRRWAQSKLDAGQEPPWAWYRYMQLVDAINGIIDGRAATVTLDPSPSRGGGKVISIGRKRSVTRVAQKVKVDLPI